MRGVLLLSGGIDSPVAGYLMARQGVELVLAYFDNRPFSDGAELEKVRKLMARLDEATGSVSRKFLIHHGAVQETLAANSARNMACVLCRRSMFRAADVLARKVDASFILTGESMGQVASQTLTNMFVEEEAARLPVLRPLIGLDKIEIERIAKEIGTYEISVMPTACCSRAPDKPATYSRLSAALQDEEGLGLDELAVGEVEEATEIE